MDIIRDVYLNYAIKLRVVGRFVKILVKQDKVELSSLSVFTQAFVVVIICSLNFSVGCFDWPLNLVIRKLYH